MKKISVWAKNHVWQSRLVIVLIYILLNGIGILTGKLLNEINVIIPELYFIGCICATIILWVWYPSAQNANSAVKRAASYSRRKFFDFSLAAVTFLMIVYGGNHWEHLFIKTEVAQATKVIRISKDSSLIKSPILQHFITSIKNMEVNTLTQKEKLKVVKQQIKKIQEQKETSKGEKTALIALSVLIALILLYGLAALSCSISCGGSEALAIIVAIAGTFLIIFFLVKIIKRISNPRRNKERWLIKNSEVEVMQQLHPLLHHFIQYHSSRNGHIERFKIVFHGNAELFISNFH